MKHLFPYLFGPREARGRARRARVSGLVPGHLGLVSAPTPWSTSALESGGPVGVWECGEQASSSNATSVIGQHPDASFPQGSALRFRLFKRSM